MKLLKTKKKKVSTKNDYPLIKDPDYMDVKEVANLIKMTTSHIYTLTSRKKIPHIKLSNKKVIFDRAEINKWLNSKKVSVR